MRQLSDEHPPAPQPDDNVALTVSARRRAKELKQIAEFIAAHGVTRIEPAFAETSEQATASTHRRDGK